MRQHSRSRLFRRSLAAIGLVAAVTALPAGPVGADLTDWDQFWHRNLPGDGDQFGRALATGDLDGDGYLDLAIGVPYDELSGGPVNTGSVRVLYGGPGGLSAAGQQHWHQDSPGTLDSAEAQDHYGWALAAGDFDADGFDDLAVGVPQEDLAAGEDAGAVHVLYGSAAGLTAAGDQFFYQDFPGILDEGAPFDTFGDTLTVGDFNGDGYEDLAIGAPLDDLGGIEDAGKVNILYGTAQGLSTAGNELWHQNNLSQGGAEAFDWFGDALATGDFDDDTFDDLAVGIRGEDIGAVANAGAVHAIYGFSGGLSATGDQVWHQDRPGIADACEAGDGFGYALAGGDFDGDDMADLAIGVPAESLGAQTNAGALHILFGSGTGLTAGGSQFWHQSVPGTQGGAEAGDYFANALAAGDFDDSGHADLAVGIPTEDLGSAVINAGAIHVFYGGEGGLGTGGNRVWHQDSPGIQDQAEENDSFGAVLAAGDFDGNGATDLAVGIPLEDIDTTGEAGAAQVFYAELGIFADGFESGDLTAWSGSVP